MKAKELTGKTFGRLHVIHRAKNSPLGKARWECLCDCGKISIATSDKLISGKTKSCGCLGVENATNAKIRHGDAPFDQKRRPRIYSTWAAMKRRCYNKNVLAYKYYGGKGVTVCASWHKYEAFKAWALSHGYAEYLEIDRIDPNGDYSPENCQWLTGSENKRKMHREKIVR